MTMLNIGKYNTLRITKKVDFGLYLDGANYGEILLPRRYAPTECEVGDELEVFIYLDSEDRLIATTEKPKAIAGELAYLKIVAINKVGAFADWGLMKDLLIPFSEQDKPMIVGRSYVVAVFFDEQTETIAGSTKLRWFLEEENRYFHSGDAVDLMIIGRTDIGYKAAINQKFIGMLYENELYKTIRVGDTYKGYIKHIRQDKRIDLSLQPPSHQAHDDLMTQIVEHLKQQGGTSPLSDKASPEDIQKVFKTSKANYKRALGRLYKQGIILLSKDKVTLV